MIDFHAHFGNMARERYPAVPPLSVHQLIDRIADYRANVTSLPVMAQVEPGYLKNVLPQAAPQQGEPFEQILAAYVKF